jgi:hypothetical protein
VVSKGKENDLFNLTLLGLKAPLLGKKTKDDVTKDQVRSGPVLQTHLFLALRLGEP